MKLISILIVTLSSVLMLSCTHTPAQNDESRNPAGLGRDTGAGGGDVEVMNLLMKARAAGLSDIPFEIHDGNHDAIRFISTAIDLYVTLKENPKVFGPEVTQRLADGILAMRIIPLGNVQSDNGVPVKTLTENGRILINYRFLQRESAVDFATYVLHAYVEPENSYEHSAKYRELQLRK